jgi:hypothetical protein
MDHLKWMRKKWEIPYKTRLITEVIKRILTRGILSVTSFIPAFFSLGLFSDSQDGVEICLRNIVKFDRTVRRYIAGNRSLSLFVSELSSETYMRCAQPKIQQIIILDFVPFRHYFFRNRVLQHLLF